MMRAGWALMRKSKASCPARVGCRLRSTARNGTPVLQLGVDLAQDDQVAEAEPGVGAVAEGGLMKPHFCR